MFAMIVVIFYYMSRTANNKIDSKVSISERQSQASEDQTIMENAQDFKQSGDRATAGY